MYVTPIFISFTIVYCTTADIGTFTTILLLTHAHPPSHFMIYPPFFSSDGSSPWRCPESSRSVAVSAFEQRAPKLRPLTQAGRQ